jgi:cytochrome c-type biogenesis protein CcmH
MESSILGQKIITSVAIVDGAAIIPTLSNTSWSTAAMLKRAQLLILFFLVALGAKAWAAIEVHDFSSVKNQQRYEKFTEELRCPKCQNSNLAGTNSEIAVDLRRELFRMIEEGQDDEKIVDFMVSRYGDFVLYRPRLQRSNLALFAGPLLLIGAGALTIGLIVWRRRRIIDQRVELTDGEKEALGQILNASKK